MNAIEFIDAVMDSGKRSEKYSKMSNGELKNELMGVWAEITLYTKASDLIDETMERIDKIESLQSQVKELIEAGNKMTVYTEGFKHSKDWRDLVSKIEQPPSEATNE